MKCLIQNNKNSPETFNQIFKSKNPDWFDKKRYKVLLKYWKGERLIDLGCLWSEVPLRALYAQPDAIVWGLDQANEAIEALQRKYPEINYAVGDVYDTQFPDRSFDYVVAGELIEHLEEPEKFIKEAYRILDDGGILALSTPLEEAKEIGAVDKDNHIWSYSKEDIKELLTDFKQVNIKIIGSRFFPRYKYAFDTIIAFGTK